MNLRGWLVNEIVKSISANVAPITEIWCPIIFDHGAILWHFDLALTDSGPAPVLPSPFIYLTRLLSHPVCTEVWSKQYKPTHWFNSYDTDIQWCHYFLCADSLADPQPRGHNITLCILLRCGNNVSKVHRAAHPLTRTPLPLYSPHYDNIKLRQCFLCGANWEIYDT